jgi:excisionase family DNA binding protein
MTIDEARTRGTVSVQEAADILGVSRTHYYRAARAGKLPVLRVGRKVLVPVQPLLRMIEGIEPFPSVGVA